MKTDCRASVYLMKAYLFDSGEFMIEDKLWRAFVKMVFSLLIERNSAMFSSRVAINIDYTTKADEFLILSASIPFQGRAIPIYFSMRRYPKKAGMIDQKAMEKAFLLELSRLLPRQENKYTIVADRGFCNSRFIGLCRQFGFNFIIRTSENRNIELEDWKGNMKDLSRENQDFETVRIKSGGFESRLIVSVSKDGKVWYILTDLSEEPFDEIIRRYADRFQIEKMFQDQKSSGFEMEKSKIRKYSRFKRLLFCIYVAQALMMFVGDWINGEADEIRKKYQLHINLISEYSKLESAV